MCPRDDVVHPTAGWIGPRWRHVRLSVFYHCSNNRRSSSFDRRAKITRAEQGSVRTSLVNFILAVFSNDFIFIHFTILLKPHHLPEAAYENHPWGVSVYDVQFPLDRSSTERTYGSCGACFWQDRIESLTKSVTETNKNIGTKWKKKNPPPCVISRLAQSQQFGRK